MSIRRPRGPKPTLQHLAFFEAMREHVHEAAESRALRASLLTLRLFDEWMLSGALVADGSAPIVNTTRAAVDALHEDSDLQFLLTRIIDGMLMLREANPMAVLPRLAALAELYSQRGASSLATDVRTLIAGFSSNLAVRISAPTEAMT